MENGLHSLRSGSEEIADDITMHERMYKIATAKYNPFAVGGSENLGGSKK